ncbi:ribonuclease HII [Tropicimonas isoalkanivorans]|uniref:Ribonuclease HII n=1 Tax=Tropicimonas isoalkanivorans TaxID=441112 RepID=A0A1I1L481_9RHOB|nr:ribonuclease HII [Tropicimonas isoalkanivorans]SFC65203.1 RNase HII [Tropicimonas isoalkanivorans]
MSPHLAFEQAAWARGARFVVGMDEVGRGPLAGPVTAAAVVLDRTCIPDGLDDSKKLSAKRRMSLAQQIHQTAQVAIVHVGVEEIERLNILHASQLAMARALSLLAQEPDFALVDGNRLPPDLPCAAQTVVGGDALCLSIAAASIVAKVARDSLMVDLAQQHPGYGWERNAGYPTPEHKLALQNLGITPHHRRSFAPVRNILYQVKTPSA